MPEQLWSTTLDPTKRRLKQITVDEAVEAEKTLSLLMGDKVRARPGHTDLAANPWEGPPLAWDVCPLHQEEQHVAGDRPGLGGSRPGRMWEFLQVLICHPHAPQNRLRVCFHDFCLVAACVCRWGPGRSLSLHGGPACAQPCWTSELSLSLGLLAWEHRTHHSWCLARIIQENRLVDDAVV